MNKDKRIRQLREFTGLFGHKNKETRLRELIETIAIQKEVMMAINRAMGSNIIEYCKLTCPKP